MTYLSDDEIETCSGGWLNYTLTYLTFLDMAHEFGRGLGDGFFDGVQEPETP